MTKISVNAEQRLFFVVNLLAASFSALLLITGKAYSYAPLALLLIALPMLSQIKKADFTPEIRNIFITFGLFFLLVPCSLFIYGGDLSEADMPSRIVLALPILLLLLRYPPKTEWLLNSFAIGAIIAGAIAIYHVQVLGAPRAYDANTVKGYMAIQSGNMAMSLSVFSLIGLFYYLTKKQVGHSLLFILAVGMGAVGSLLSGSRGGWVLTPFVMLFICYQNRHLLSKKVLLTGSAVLLALVTFSYPKLEIRVNEALSDINRYGHNDNYQNSIGARAEMWKSAWYSFSEKPIFGPGFPGREASKLKQVELQLVDPIVEDYGRAHNQYLEELSTKGLVGFAALMAIFLVPLRVFRQRLASKQKKQQYIAVCGVAHVLLVAGYCLTQNYLNHNSGIIFYCILTVILLASCLKPEPET